MAKEKLMIKAGIQNIQLYNLVLFKNQFFKNLLKKTITEYFHKCKLRVSNFSFQSTGLATSTEACATIWSCFEVFEDHLDNKLYNLSEL